MPLLAGLLLAGLLQADPRCAGCHPKEDAAYAKTGMARSLTLPKAGLLLPGGEFEHEFSKTKFVVHSDGNTMMQSLSRGAENDHQNVAFVIGSGNHAFGFLTQISNHVFQSPLSYYTKTKLWDVAPGYELDPHPDFSRPATVECLSCHSGKPLAVPDTLNTFQPGIFSAYGITCERCHGDVRLHLQNPVPGSILNPARLTGAARASICEQCHLTGEIRVPNPGKTIVDFKPGQVLEDDYTTYVAAASSGQTIKVVSHSEQLALSLCARASGEKLWCGSCHNPHETPVQPAAYFRDRCLGCHAATLDKAHAAPGRDCIACHMPKLSAKDGGHTAFTDHRIARTFSDVAQPAADTLTAWRQPDAYVKDRNLAIALVTVGLQNSASSEVIQGYKMLNHLVNDFPNDPALFTSLGSVLLKAKEPVEALKCYRRAATLKPDYAPYYVNTAVALINTGQMTEAVAQLEKARALDPSLRQAVELLQQVPSKR